MPDQYPLFIELTSDPSQMIRRAALNGLIQYKNEQTLDCLLHHANSSDVDMKQRSLTILAKRSGKKVAVFFTDVIANDDRDQLSYAIRFFGAQGQAKDADLIWRYIEDEDYNLRSITLQSLLQLKDPRAIEKLDEKLLSDNQVVRNQAVSSILHSRVLPPSHILADLSDDNEVIQNTLVYILQKVQNSVGEKGREDIRKIFGILKNNMRPEIRLKAIQGLYELGDKQIITPYMKRLRVAYGGELREAIKYVASELKIADAGPIMFDRFKSDKDLDSSDRLVLLEGLKDINYKEALGVCFDVIKGEYNSRSSFKPPLTFDLRVTFMVHNFGDEVISHWMDALKVDQSNRMIYLFINGARLLESPGATDQLLSIADDEKRPLWIREAAIMSFPFLRAPGVGKKLVAYSQREINPKLSDMAIKIFWCYF